MHQRIERFENQVISENFIQKFEVAFELSWRENTALERKFSIKDFFSRCDQIHRKPFHAVI